MNKLTLKDIDVSGKRALVRVDFNVPFDNKDAITDDSRIKAALPTINYLIEHGAKVVLCSHLGRPDGKVVESMRLTPVAERLAKLLGKPVATTKDCIGPEAEKAANNLKNGDVLLLENLRFHAEEEANDPVFSQNLAKLVELYVDDAFGTAHRAHASIVGVTKYLPAVCGMLLQKELEMLGGIVENPAHPFASLVGGAKVSDKVAVLQNIMNKANVVLVGGGMAATFLKAKSYEVGASLVETARIDTAKELMSLAAKKNVNLMLPVDAIVTEEINSQAKGKVVEITKVGPKDRIVDIGPQTIKDFTAELNRCKTVFWNGPMGIYEIPQFAEGTKAMAKLLASLKATTVIGGGSTADMVAEMGLADKMTFVSTGGGASLSLLGGEKLPGVEALLDKDSPASKKLKR